ncbi:hypothetical protein F7725_022242, partial [Dissostichus mawsoni]
MNTILVSRQAESVAIPSTESFGSLPSTRDLCLVEPFKCPACTPDMLAIAVDGNRKHYRFRKSRGYDTVLAMQWNHRKVEKLHKTFSKRFVKTTQRAQTEVDNLESLKQELNISLEDTEQWVLEVKQWQPL